MDIPSSAATYHLQSRLYNWRKDHPPSQIIGNPYIGMPTNSSIDLTNHCHYIASLSSIEPKTTKEALLELDWITTMQEELVEFKRNQV